MAYTIFSGGKKLFQNFNFGTAPIDKINRSRGILWQIPEK
jgi:hypothetical protein